LGEHIVKPHSKRQCVLCGSFCNPKVFYIRFKSKDICGNCLNALSSVLTTTTTGYEERFIRQREKIEKLQRIIKEKKLELQAIKAQRDFLLVDPQGRKLEDPIGKLEEQVRKLKDQVRVQKAEIKRLNHLLDEAEDKITELTAW